MKEERKFEPTNVQLERRRALKEQLRIQCETFQHLNTRDSLTYNWVKLATTTGPKRRPEELVDNFKDIKDSVLQLIAESPTTKTETLEVLAHSSSSLVRQAVADNSRTPLVTLERLALDTDAEVRFALAENHNIPDSILEILIRDENPYVRVRAEWTMAKLHRANSADAS